MADTPSETQAERDARIRDKNRRMIPWIVLACLAPVVVLGGLLAVILLPALLLMSDIMRHEGPVTKPSHPIMAQVVTGDFDRDGRPDFARMMPAGASYNLVIFRATGAPPDIVETIPAAQASNYFFELAKPGTYQTWCGKGGATDAEPCPARSLTLSGDVLAFGIPEAGDSVAVWDGRRFVTIRMSG